MSKIFKQTNEGLVWVSQMGDIPITFEQSIYVTNSSTQLLPIDPARIRVTLNSFIYDAAQGFISLDIDNEGLILQEASYHISYTAEIVDTGSPGSSMDSFFGIYTPGGTFINGSASVPIQSSGSAGESATSTRSSFFYNVTSSSETLYLECSSDQTGWSLQPEKCSLKIKRII